MDQVRPRQAKPVQTVQAEAPARQSRRRRKWPWVIVAVILVIFLALFTAYKVVILDKQLKGVEKNAYQALFLTNGQVYFGKLQRADADTIKISDIYYLQVQQTVQPKAEESASETAQGETQLVKLGGELHGPKDEMHVDRRQVLFWENLNDNSKVVEAINAYTKQ